MQIEKQLNLALQARRSGDFSELRDFMKKATPHLGFLGSRYITVKDCEGTLGLDLVPSIVAIDGYKEVSGHQKKVVEELSERITGIYILYDQILRTSNIVSRYLGILREVCTLKYLGFERGFARKAFSRQRWMENVIIGWSSNDIEDLYRNKEFYRYWWRSWDFPGLQWTHWIGLNSE